MKKAVIYKFTSPSGKVYIGQSWSIIDRLSKYRTCHCEHQPKVCNSMKKYGFDAHKFEIIHELPIDVTQETLDKYEQFYIDCYKDCSIELMNIREAGSRGKHSDITKTKMVGKKLSEEHKKKISVANKGKKLRPMSDEEKKTKSLVALGKKKSKKHIQSLKKALRRDYNSGRRRKFFGESHWNTKVTIVQTIEIKLKYNSGNYTYKKLAIEYNVSTTTIYKILKNKSTNNV